MKYYIYIFLGMGVYNTVNGNYDTPMLGTSAEDHTMPIQHVLETQVKAHLNHTLKGAQLQNHIITFVKPFLKSAIRRVEDAMRTASFQGVVEKEGIVSRVPDSIRHIPSQAVVEKEERPNVSKKKTENNHKDKNISENLLGTIEVSSPKTVSSQQSSDWSLISATLNSNFRDTSVNGVSQSSQKTDNSILDYPSFDDMGLSKFYRNIGLIPSNVSLKE